MSEGVVISVVERSGLQERLFLHPPPPALFCRGCRRLLCEPRISTLCGHSFCWECFEGSDEASDSSDNEEGRPVCEVDSSSISLAQSVPNLAVEIQIGDLMVFCRHAKLISPPSGSGSEMLDRKLCRVSVRYSKVEEHERTCDHTETNCPFSRKCPLVRRRELALHIEKCEFKEKRQSPFEEEAVYLSQYLTMLTDHFEKVSQHVMRIEKENEELMASIQNQQRLLKEQEEQAAAVPVEALKMPFYFQCTGTFRGHNGPVWALGYHGDYLVSAGSDQLMKVWDLNTFDCVRTLEGHQGVIHAIVIAKGRIYSGDSVGTLRVWELNGFREIKACKVADSILSALAVSLTANLIFVATFACIEVLNADSLDCTQTIQGLQHWVRALVIDASDAFLYASCHSKVYVWSTATLKPEKSINTKYGSIHSLALTSKYLICGTYNQNIDIYDIKSCDHKQKLVGHIGIVMTLATSTSGQFLFSGSLDATINIWNLENMLVVQTLNRHEAKINALVWYRNILFSAGADEAVKMFKFTRGSLGMVADKVS